MPLRSGVAVLFASVLLTCAAADLPCSPSCEHGVCKADHGQLDCKCDHNWFGPDCSEFVCAAMTGVCENGGTCVQHPTNDTALLCACPADVLGDRCQLTAHSDSCTNKTCNMRGHCYGNTADSYVCVCDDGSFGRDCEFRVTTLADECVGEVENCYGHGRCIYNFDGRHNCSCDLYYEPHFDCKELIGGGRNSCLAMPFPCRNGGICTATGSHQYTCHCPTNFTGTNCTEPIDVCSGACENGSLCSVIADGHYFQCETPPVCYNGGTLLSSDPPCECPPGYRGNHCETRDPCSASPCWGHTTAPGCLNIQEEPGFVCVCEEGWGGGACSVQLTCDDNGTGGGAGSGSVLLKCPEYCGELAGNGVCDEMCNSPQCTMDGWDCDPWQACANKNACRESFLDGVCDAECSTEVCLYDGGECVSPLGACQQEAECRGVAGDGVCQQHCYTAKCPFDGEDCSDEGRKFAENKLVMILFSEPSRPFTSPWKEQFLRDLGRLINSVPVIREVSILTRHELLESYHVQPPTDDNWLIYRVIMQLDVSHCQQQCPQDAQESVRWIQAAIASGHPNFGPYAAQSASSQPDGGSSASSTVIYGVVGGGVVLVVLALLVVGVLIGKRRRLTAKIWRPTSPSSEASPSTDGGGQSGALPAAQGTEAMYMETGAKKAKMFNGSGNQVEWVDCTAPISSTDSKNVVLGQRGWDSRQWGVAHTRDVGKLVQQYKQLNGSHLSVDTPGPGGFTPLMLAVMRRPGTLSSMNYQSRSSSESSSDDQTALIPVPRGTPRHMLLPPIDSSVPMLIEAKANLDAVNDYNQTALHLAAACSRPEYVDHLVENGANPNIQDNWGQTTLHAAIGAGAEGAFLVLLNCPRIKYNLKSDGGITPLMSAVKMVNGFMVKQLLKKDAEIISSADEEGRTAVHWAAMVDNVEALRMLVKCGAETSKDAQDSKGQTPLFLACREGSIMCVKHLIDCFANVTLLDNLEQSPLQVAMQKQYVDIVELLRASSHGPLYMRPGPHNGFLPEVAAYSPSGHTPHHQLVTPPTSKKRKSKNASSNSASNGGHLHKFLPSQVSYPGSTATPTSLQHGETLAMSELHMQQQANSNGPYVQHESPPTYPSHSPPLPPHCHPSQSPPTYPSHSPPLPPHCQQHLSPSSHGHYSVATPTTSCYSVATPTTYDELPCNGHMLEGYYPGTADVGTRPLQHLPEPGVQTSFVVTSSMGGPITADPFVQNPVYSPPQSGGSQRSPQSAQHSSPHSTGYGASPQSLTPSPESQQQTIAAVGTVHHVEPGYSYPGHTIHQQHFMGSTPV